MEYAFDPFTLIAALISIVLTELIKWPVKKRLGDKPLANYLYIGISLAFTIGCYFGLLFIQNGFSFVELCNADNYVRVLTGLLVFIGTTQLAFNFIWKNGIKAFLVRINPKAAILPTPVTDKIDEFIKKIINGEATHSDLQVVQSLVAQAKEAADAKEQEKQEAKAEKGEDPFQGV